jgi:hypothetical protein
LPVFTACPLFVLKRLSTRQLLLPFVSHSFDVIWMEDLGAKGASVTHDGHHI